MTSPEAAVAAATEAEGGGAPVPAAAHPHRAASPPAEGAAEVAGRLNRNPVRLMLLRISVLPFCTFTLFRQIGN